MILDTFNVDIAGVRYHVVLSNEMRVVVGTKLAARIRLEVEKGPDPLRQKTSA